MVASLSRQQIKCIKERIGQEGVRTADLAEDILDHLCTCIEEEMEGGLCFEKAFEKVFNNLEEDELKLTEMKTQELLEGKKAFYPDLFQSFVLIIIFVVGSLFLRFVINAVLISDNGEQIREVIEAYYPLYVVILNTVLFGGVIGYAILEIRKTQGNIPIFSFRPVPPYVYLVVACIATLFLFWTEPLAMLSLVSLEEKSKILTPLQKHGLMAVILVAVINSILSELLFRGIILKGLLRTLTPGKAIFWSSVFFIAVNYKMPLYVFTLGLIQGWIYWKTKSLLPTIFLMVFGSVAFYSALFYMGHWGEMFTWREWFGNLWLYVGVIAVSFLLTLGLLYYLHRKLSVKNQT